MEKIVEFGCGCHWNGADHFLHKGDPFVCPLHGQTIATEEFNNPTDEDCEKEEGNGDSRNRKRE